VVFLINQKCFRSNQDLGSYQIPKNKNKNIWCVVVQVVGDIYGGFGSILCMGLPV
jgi:hypothetical protein